MGVRQSTSFGTAGSSSARGETNMKKKTTKRPPETKSESSSKAGVGAHGAKGRPRTGEGGGKWPGGGKKGENE